jgi:hypothetical protein
LIGLANRLIDAKTRLGFETKAAWEFIELAAMTNPGSNFLRTCRCVYLKCPGGETIRPIAP